MHTQLMSWCPLAAKEDIGVVNQTEEILMKLLESEFLLSFMNYALAIYHLG